MSEITKALVKFQRDCPAVIKDRTAKIPGRSDYRYADLSAIMSTIRPVLSECGLFLSQSFETNGTTHLVTCLMHEAGETITSRIELPINGLPPQQVGSAITYYRRYSISSLLGIAAEDDDGEAAEKAGAVHGSKMLKQQLQDSIKAEQKVVNEREQIAAKQFAENSVYAEFLKDTPQGKCWKVTAIQQSMRDFVRDLESQYDADEFKGFLDDNKVALDVCAIAMPTWYYGKEGSDVPGIEKRIGEKREQLKKIAKDDPARRLRA